MSSPILLILFNRPDLTVGLLDIVSGQRGRRIYIAADGPRLDKAEDEQLCSEVHKIARAFSENYDGECRLQLQTTNLGCGPGVKAAIDWFFENEESGIILEDDCHPGTDFFRFQDEMLEHYRDDNSVFLISGSSFLPPPLTINAPSFFTKYTQIWGWGTWRTSWEKYEFLLKEENRDSWTKIIESTCPDLAERFYWMREFNKLCGKPVPHTWDYQLQFSLWKVNGKCLWPTKNLVTNRGLRSDATHTLKPSDYLCQEACEFHLSLDECAIDQSAELDKLLFWFHFLEGDVNRFRYILFESDYSIQANLKEISALGDIYTCRRILADPMLGEVVDLAGKWLKKMLIGKQIE
jgi:hypothetical protein